MLKLLNADTAENFSDTKNSIITPVSCALPSRLPNGPKMSGTDPVTIVRGTRLRAAVGSELLEGQYFCNYAVNEEYEPRFAVAGLMISARGPAGETRAVEIPAHRFFVATLFQPQLSSTEREPHPVILALLKACQRFRDEKPPG